MSVALSKLSLAILDGVLLLALIVSLLLRLVADRAQEDRTRPADAGEVGQILSDADAAYQRLDLARASVHYADVLKRDPENTTAKIQLAAIFHRNAWPETAMTLLAEVLRREPNNTAALLLRARVYRDEGESELAARDYEHVLAPNRRNAEALYYLGTAYQAARRMEEAIRAYQDAISSDPALARPLFEEVPFGIQARLQLGRTYKQLAQTQESARNMNDALALLDLTLVELRQAVRDARRARLEGYAEASAELAEALRTKGTFLRRALRSERDVLECFEEITRFDPDDVSAWVEAGEIRYRLARSRADLKVAGSYFAKAYQLDPRDLDALKNLTAVRQDLARPDDELRLIFEDSGERAGSR